MVASIVSLRKRGARLDCYFRPRDIRFCEFSDKAKGLLDLGGRLVVLADGVKEESVVKYRAAVLNFGKRKMKFF